MRDVTSHRGAISRLRIASLRAHLRRRGYVSRGEWGRYLERFSRKSGGREENVLVPTTREINDFERRMVEAIESLARQLQESAETIIREIVNAGYETIRIKVNEGRDESTLSYDAAIDLLAGGFALIDSSAVVAVSDVSLPIIRGRRPDLVRKYLDEVRVGQTEVGSFILTLLMPVSLEGEDLQLPEAVSDSFGVKVAERLSGSLRAAEQAVRGSGPHSNDALAQLGLTANFSGGIARILEAAGDATIALGSVRERKGARLAATKFTAEDAHELRAIERRLTPSDEREPFTIRGTVTEFREPRGKASGSIAVTCDVHGEMRPVRMKFARDHRNVVVQAIEKKADVFLAVDGELTSKGGHYHLENAAGFRIERRAPLA